MSENTGTYQAGKRHNLTLEGIITLMSPLSHIGEVRGTDSLLIRASILDEAGRPRDVFRYNGNAYRGMLRDCGSLYLFEKLGDPKMPLETLYLFTAGGAIAGEQVVDLARAEAMRKSFPLLSIFGGGAKSQILEGKLNVGFGIPLVQECQAIIPARYRNADALPWRLWTEEVYFTRVDDAKKERFKPYIAEPESALPEPKKTPALPESDVSQESLFADAQSQSNERLDGGDAAKRTGKDDKPKKKENPQQMRAMVECLCAGARLYHRIDIHDASELELGALVSALDYFSRRPYLGGKCGAGFGLCEVHYDYFDVTAGGQRKEFMAIGENRVKLGPVAAEAKQAYDNFLLSIYQKYLAENQTPLTEMLGAAK
ncbi:MAG: hypothetical protein RDU41_05940 [Clostridia bacterium]|nr:hypothetical protein [Clostridia bacterium]